MAIRKAATEARRRAEAARPVTSWRRPLNFVVMMKKMKLDPRQIQNVPQASIDSSTTKSTPAMISTAAPTGIPRLVANLMMLMRITAPTAYPSRLLLSTTIELNGELQ